MFFLELLFYSGFFWGKIWLRGHMFQKWVWKNRQLNDILGFVEGHVCICLLFFFTTVNDHQTTIWQNMFGTCSISIEESQVTSSSIYINDLFFRLSSHRGQFGDIWWICLPKNFRKKTPTKSWIWHIWFDFKSNYHKKWRIVFKVGPITSYK